MNDRKQENKELLRKQSLAKIEALRSNNQALENKRQTLEERIRANNNKIAKIEFFLAKLDNPAAAEPAQTGSN